MCCIFSIVITFGRYVSKSVSNFFVRSKEFYFNADKLSENTSVGLTGSYVLDVKPGDYDYYTVGLNFKWAF